jgi:hypothetical protein
MRGHPGLGEAETKPIDLGGYRMTSAPTPSSTSATQRRPRTSELAGRSFWMFLAAFGGFVAFVAFIATIIVGDAEGSRHAPKSTEA